MIRSDFLVIGGGLAGLRFALEVADIGTVNILFKKERLVASTSWAQGGIAAVTTADDSYDLHVQDTLSAGAGLCDPEVVKLVVEEGPARVAELISYGAHFDKESLGYHLHQEGGHSRRRIFHAADSTGSELMRVLIEQTVKHPNIRFIEHCTAIDLITTAKLGCADKKNRILGAYVLGQAGDVQIYAAPQVLVATGGAGKVYLYTSNPDVASGDGIAMCYRAGVAVRNLEFYQFHPTCLYHPQAKSFLITEALRGEGAKLRRVKGESFMENFDSRLELASRDIVARAIDSTMKEHGEEYVLLDATSLGESKLKEHFPSIYERCLQFGIDIASQGIPVVPAAHYCCGGVESGLHGETSIEGLYVAGEVAHTGLHGGNRLASNSLLEGLVFAYRAARHAIESRDAYSSDLLRKNIPSWDSGHASHSDEAVVVTQNWDEVRRSMWNYVGIVRTTKRLERALRRIELIKQEIHQYYWDFYITSDLLELRNLCQVSELIIRSALLRKESRGLHYSLDYPEVLPELACDTILDPLKEQ